MSCSTPIKSDDQKRFNETLTPVHFPDSPKLKLNSTDSNVLACKSRLDIITKTLNDNYSKWQLADKRGRVFCSAIETIKTRLLNSINITGNLPSENDDASLYSKELKPHCDKLCCIVGIFSDILKSAKESLHQLKALKKLPNCCQEVYFRSWTLFDFIDFITDLVCRYEAEIQIKRFVMENLSHCVSQADLIRGTTMWEYPQYVDTHVSMMFTFLNKEISTK